MSDADTAPTSAPPPPVPPPAPTADAAPPRRWFADARERWTVFGLLGLAFLLRLAVLVQSADAPYYDTPIGDSMVYDLWGQDLAGLADAKDLFRNRVFYQDPLYPYFLGGIYKVFGRSQGFTRFLQILVGLGSCALLYAVGRRLFGRAVAAVALAVAALYKPFLFYDTLLLKTVLEVFFLLLATWLLLAAQARDRWWRWLLAGLALGVGALGRANFLLLVPVLLVWLRVAGPAPRWGPSLARWTWIVLGALAGVAPATIHNAAAGGEFVLTTAQGGPNFVTGNHPDNQSGRYRPPAFVVGNPLTEARDWRAEAERRENRALSEGEIDRYWWKEGIRYVLVHPGLFLKGLARKTILFWHAYEFPDFEDINLTGRFVPLLRWPLPAYAIVSPLGLLGMALALGAWRRHLLPLLVVAVYAGSIVLFFLFSRYRVPSVPFLILFAAYAALWIRDRIAERRTAAAAAAAAAGLVLFLGTSVVGVVAGDMESWGFGLYRPLVAYYNLGNYRMQRGESDAARAEFESALEIEADRARAGRHPWGRTPDIHTKLAELALTKAQGLDPKKDAAAVPPLLAEAKTHLDEALRIAPNWAAAYRGLGVWDRLRGDTDAAIADFGKALDLQPGFHDARLGLAETYWARGETGKAKDTLAETLLKGPAPSQAEAHALLGDIAIQADDSAEARKEWEAAIACYPFHLGARRRMMRLERRLAEAYLAKKDMQAANVALVRAVYHAEVVARLDPTDETATSLLMQYQKMLSRKAKK